MDFPKQVKVGSVFYKIERVSRHDFDSDRHSGRINYRNQTISLASDTVPQKFITDLLHEIMHAIYAEWVVNSEDPEERIVTQFTYGIAAVLVDNPRLFSYIEGVLLEGASDEV